VSEAPSAQAQAKQSPVPQQPLASVLGRNTLFSYLGRFWGLGVALLLTPYLYHKLGDELFGVWALLATLSGCSSLVDIVTSVGLTKYVAQAQAKQDIHAVNQFVSTGLVVQAGLGGLLMGAAWLLAAAMLTWRNVSWEARPVAHTALLISMAAKANGAGGGGSVTLLTDAHQSFAVRKTVQELGWAQVLSCQLWFEGVQAWEVPGA